MKRSVAEQRNIEVAPGFSPKPISALETVAEDSPSDSNEPDTHSPTALLEGPIVQRRVTSVKAEDVSVRNGVVSFGK